MVPIPGTSQSQHSAVAFLREFESSGGGVIQYIQYRGYGSPSLSTGRPGDMFIDMSPNAYRLFIRYEEWREWLGVYRSAVPVSDKPSFQFNHPKDGTRTIWCSTTDILWYRKNSISKVKTRLFSMGVYINHEFVSAHELILESGTLSRQTIPVTQKFMGHKELHLRGKMREKHDIPGLESSTQDIPTPQVAGGSPLEYNSIGRRLVSGSTSRPDFSPGTRSRKEAQTSASSKAFTGLQPNQVLSIHKRSFESSTSPTTGIIYKQYRGHGVPSLNLGSLGDFYVDRSPSAYRLFVRYQDWLEWPGIYSTAGLDEDPLDGEFLHPEDPTRVVWCTDVDVVWFKSALIRHSKVRHFAGEPAGTVFISAHDLISRSSLGGQIRSKRPLLLIGHSEEHTKIKKRKISGDKPPSVSDSEPPSPAEPQTTPPLPHPKPQATNSDSPSPSPDSPLSFHVESARPSPIHRHSGLLPLAARDDMSRHESQLPGSSPLTSMSELENGMPRAMSLEAPSPPTSFLQSIEGADSLIHKVESLDGTMPTNLSEVAAEAKRTRRVEELHTRRKERYQNRRQELVQNELEIAAQEEQLREAEIRAKERLENARKNALKRKEEIQQREEELRKEKEELTAREVEVFQREQALKRRKERLEQMEGMIGNINED